MLDYFMAHENFEEKFRQLEWNMHLKLEEEYVTSKYLKNGIMNDFITKTDYALFKNDLIS